MRVWLHGHGGGVSGGLVVAMAVVLLACSLDVSAVVLTNVALNKPTRQISTSTNGRSLRAVDGNKNDDFDTHPYCAQTENAESYQWWMVDLLEPRDIHAVEITNRVVSSTDLGNVTIYVTNTYPSAPTEAGVNVPYEICQTIPGTVPGGPNCFSCDSIVSGRYVVVMKWSGMVKLTLCEVEVLASKLNPFSFQKRPFKTLEDTASGLAAFDTIIESGKTTCWCLWQCRKKSGSVTTMVKYKASSGLCQCFESSPFSGHSLLDANGDTTMMAEDGEDSR